ncbi:S9C family peptidase [Vigna unguiculata]|uniref:S9C family peptidase n=1 Tax=Vigna unguiculata TaxID=3917 RepID=A0A4D6NLW1_VIGUN|nr:S9C family peptidase [Vigna unguiculata]
MGSKSSRDRTEFNGDDEVALHNQEAKLRFHYRAVSNQLGDERGSCVVVRKSFGCDFLGEEVIRGGKHQKKNDVADGKIRKALGDIGNLANAENLEGEAVDITPKEFGVRTLAQEYGGGAFTVSEDVVFFANYKDQRLYKRSIRSLGELFFITDRRNGFWNLHKWVILSLFMSKSKSCSV